MNRLVLSEAEVGGMKTLLAGLKAQYTSIEDESFLGEASLFAAELPRRLRSFLNDFRLFERSGTCMISGYPVDDYGIGSTPPHWNRRPAISNALEQEMLLVLFGSLLGEVLGWATQQDGYIVHEVLPIKDYEDSQLGTGSQQTLWWHNEDAFHPYRGDYLALMCLRNPDRVATTFASIDTVDLTQDQIEVLFERRFAIKPDESHSQQNNSSYQLSNPEDEVAAAYDGINRMTCDPDKLAVLFGDPRSPYVRIDPYFMDPPSEDERAKGALDALIQAIDSNLSDVILQPGDYLFIDNYRTVHGRKPFKAKYDGTDRWLKRVNITRDLRKSRDSRTSCSSRVIFSR
jgi:Fe(II)/alpha-ketoglutarate-dependent arginine beta-hydroxylase